MKILIIATVAAGVSAFAGFSGANAQKLASVGFDKNNVETIVAAANDFVPGGDEISPKALKSFAKMYKNVSAEKWTKIRSGYSASFVSEGRKNTIFYNAKGNWYGSVTSYTEDKLPTDVRNIVRSKYFDYSIFFVEEVETVESNGTPTYLIHLEDKRNIKLVRVSDGEMETWKEYVKS
jgi:hypothetical protein